MGVPCRSPDRSTLMGLEEPGLTTMRSWRDGAEPEPFNRAAGIEVLRVEPGEVDVELRPPWPVAADGQLFPGVAFAAADAAVGAATYTLLPAGWSSVTMQLRVHYLPVRPAGDTHVTATSSAVYTGTSTGLATGAVLDAAGRLCAEAGCRVMVLPMTEDVDPPVPRLPDYPYTETVGQSRPPNQDGAAQRPEHLSPADPERLIRTGWVQMLRPRIVTSDEHGAEIRMSADHPLANEWGDLHGGAVAMAVEIAMALSLCTWLSDGRAMAPLDVNVDYLRPTSIGEEIVCLVEPTRIGRRVAVLHARLQNPDGALAAVGSSTVLLG